MKYDRARSPHLCTKGGVKHDDQEDLEEDGNNLQVQEFLLIQVQPN